MNRQDLNPIAATRDDYSSFKQLSATEQVGRLVSWALIYLLILGVVSRAASWMILAPLWEREVQGQDSSLEGRLKILSLVEPPVSDVDTHTAIFAQTGTALLGFGVLLIFGKVPESAGAVERMVRLAIILAWSGWLIADPALGVIHKLNNRSQ